MASTEKHTIEGWQARLNVQGEQVTREEAMLLHLGHQNYRLELLVTALEDIQMRVTRMELFLQSIVPNYDAYCRARLKLELSEKPEQKSKKEQPA